MADPSEHELPGIPGSYGGAPTPPQLGPAPARGGLFERLDGRPITGNDQQPGTPTVMVLSGWGARAGAAMLDSLILLLPRLLLIGALVSSHVIDVKVTGTGSSTKTDMNATAALELFAAWFFVNLLYAPIQLAAFNGATLGKRAAGIRVVREDGAKISWSFGALREVVVKDLLFWGVGLYTLLILPVLNLLWPLWDHQNRALHDMLVKTRVVRAQA